MLESTPNDAKIISKILYALAQAGVANQLSSLSLADAGLCEKDANGFQRCCRWLHREDIIRCSLLPSKNAPMTEPVITAKGRSGFRHLIRSAYRLEDVFASYHKNESIRAQRLTSRTTSTRRTAERRALSSCGQNTQASISQKNRKKKKNPGIMN